MRRPSLFISIAVSVLLAVMLVPAAAVAPTSPGSAPRPGTVIQTPADTSGPAVTRYFGATRADTASLIARDGFPDADTILLARQDNFPDSLGGGFLAGQFNAPVVLTDPTSLSPEAQTVITDLTPSRVIILGGVAAVSATIESELRDAGMTVDRLAGPGRYDTGAAIATAPGTTVGTLDGDRVAILASGTNFPDALVMSALSHARGWPLLLTDPAALTSQTQEALGDLEIDRVLLAGGPTAVGPAVQTAVETLGIDVTRLAGDNRVATGIAIAEFAVAQAGLDPSTVNLATGRAFPDALALGPLAGSDPSPVLLTNGADDLGGASITGYLDDLVCTDGIRVSGGTVALSDALVTGVRTRLADLTACPTPTPTPSPSPTPTPTPSPTTSPPTCTDDTNEPNDTVATAATVASGSAVSGQTCPDDLDDYYTLDVLPGQTLTVDLDFTDATSDLDLFIVDANGDLRADSSSITDDESAVYELPVGVPLPLAIAIFDQDEDGAPYALTATVTDPTCPDDDRFEPNSLFSQARPIAPALVTAGRPLQLRGVTCPGDDASPFGTDDNFELRVTPGQTVDATLDFDHDDADLDLYLIDGDQADTIESTLSSSTTPSDQEQITLAVPPGTASTTLVSVNDVLLSGAAYTLTIEVRDPACNDTDDPFEDNDARGQAFVIPNDASFRDILCDDDDGEGDDGQDWFTTSLVQGQYATATLFDFALTPSAPEFELLSGTGDLVDQGTSTDNGFSYVARGPISRNQAVMSVVDLSGFDLPYSLRLDVRDPSCDGTSEAEDAFEPNNAQGSGPVVGFGPLVGLFCQDNAEDWFTLPSVATGDEIDVEVAFDAGVDVDLYLLDANGVNLLAPQTGTNNPERLTYTAQAGDAGPFQVRLRCATCGTTSYRLATNVTFDR